MISYGTSQVQQHNKEGMSTIVALIFLCNKFVHSDSICIYLAQITILITSHKTAVPKARRVLQNELIALIEP